MGSLSQPRLNIFTVGNMRVMICLGQGGLRSLSASSFDSYAYHYVLIFIVKSTDFAYLNPCNEMRMNVKIPTAKVKIT